MNTNEELELYKKALNESNLECSALLSSREFCLGKRIISFVNALKKGQFHQMKKLIKGKIGGIQSRTKSFVKTKCNVTLGDASDYKSRVAVYTCIVGGYDNVLEPLFRLKNVDFFLFSDKTSVTHSDNWACRDIPPELLQYDNTMINRYIKLHPHQFFPSYDFAMYIDGNVKIVNDVTPLLHQAKCVGGIAMFNHCRRDCLYDEAQMCLLCGKGNARQIKSQIEIYKKQKFPVHWGLKEATVIISDLKNGNSRKILDNWWNELKNSKSLRDQLSFPYSLWKNGSKMSDIGVLGDDIYHNEILRIYPH